MPVRKAHEIKGRGGGEQTLKSMTLKLVSPERNGRPVIMSIRSVRFPGFFGIVRETDNMTVFRKVRNQGIFCYFYI